MPARDFGRYWAAFGVGAVIGALAPGGARRLPLWPAMLAIIAGHGVGLLAFAITPVAVPSVVGFAFAGLVYGPYPALSYTLFQERVPGDSLTGVLAVLQAIAAENNPVTGGAHCALTPFWAPRLGTPTLRALQASPRGGELTCHDRGDRVGLAGRCVWYLEGEIRW